MSEEIEGLREELAAAKREIKSLRSSLQQTGYHVLTIGERNWRLEHPSECLTWYGGVADCDLNIWADNEVRSRDTGNYLVKVRKNRVKKIKRIKETP